MTNKTNTVWTILAVAIVLSLATVTVAVAGGGGDVAKSDVVADVEKAVESDKPLAEKKVCFDKSGMAAWPEAKKADWNAIQAEKRQWLADRGIEAELVEIGPGLKSIHWTPEVKLAVKALPKSEFPIKK